MDQLNFKGIRFPIDMILVCIRWSTGYPLSYRHLEEMMKERGMSVDHSTINRWAIRFLPLNEKMARKHRRSVGSTWRMDETYFKSKGIWKYLYLAVDKYGKTVDFLLPTKHGSVALLLKERNYPGTGRCPSNWTDHACQRIKLVCKRNRIGAVDFELALADHVHEFDAAEDTTGAAK